MDSYDEKVKRLLDGEIDESEIAADPVLASLAERIFGLTIEPITPTKPSQSTGLPEVEVVTAVTTQDSMIEVIPGATPKPLPLPQEMPGLPAIPKQEEKKSSRFLMFFGFSSLAVAAANVFGLFGFLNSQCVADKCTAEATRINWIDIHNISNEQGWSMPFPTLGIPDYVALACSIAVILIAFKKK